MLNIVTYLWDNPEAKHKGRFEYGAQHVESLYQGLRANLGTIEFKFTLITDRFVHGLSSEINQVQLWDHIPKYRCYPRLAMFGMEKQLGEEVLAVDLDVLITGDLTDLVEYMRYYNFCGYVDRVNTNQFSNSFLYFKPKFTKPIADLFHTIVQFDESKFPYIGSDQGWLNTYFGGIAGGKRNFEKVGIVDHAVWNIYDYPEIAKKDLPNDAKMVMFNGMDYDMSIAPETWVKKYWCLPTINEKA